MQIINLTKENITIVGETGLPIAMYPSTGLAECETTKVKLRSIDDVPIYSFRRRKVAGLPAPSDKNDNMYIVTHDVAEAVRDSRMDILVVGDSVGTTGTKFSSLINV